MSILPGPSGRGSVDMVRVLVTAGATGIGATIAKAFVSAGAQVHITDIAEDALRQFSAENPSVSYTAGDASIPQDVDGALADVQQRFGGLDVLVNNAGIAGPAGGIDVLSDADVDRTIRVNLNSQFYFTSRFVPLLKASQNNPSIISIGSVAGRLGYGLRTPYAATKWAIVGLVKSLAVELGPHGIRANAILPGAVNGARMDRVIADRAQVLEMDIEDMRDSYLQKISMRRMVDAEDVADLALFLSSAMARNITGQAISVDGNTEYL